MRDRSHWVSTREADRRAMRDGAIIGVIIVLALILGAVTAQSQRPTHPIATLSR